MTVAKIVVKFILGAMIGGLIVAKLYSNFQFSVPTLATLQMICSCLLIFYCGILAATGSRKSLGAMFKALAEASWL
jgi:Kef-type K+ transport system membrane component KefB